MLRKTGAGNDLHRTGQVLHHSDEWGGYAYGENRMRLDVETLPHPAFLPQKSTRPVANRYRERQNPCSQVNLGAGVLFRSGVATARVPRVFRV